MLGLNLTVLVVLPRNRLHCEAELTSMAGIGLGDALEVSARASMIALQACSMTSMRGKARYFYPASGRYKGLPRPCPQLSALKRGQSITKSQAP